jgi:putative serine protease PepD
VESDPHPESAGEAATARAGALFSRRVLVAAIIVAGVVGGLVGGVCVAWLRPSGSSTSTDGMVVSTAVPAVATGSVADIAARALPSVVTIQVQGTQGATGSGVIIRSDGYILTNAHVISGAATGGKIFVTRDQDFAQIPARLVGEDAKSDLAVIKIDVGQPLPAATLGQSGALRVGSPVIAMGAPIDLASSVTTGIISGLNRKATEPVPGGGSVDLIGAIQTDAAINPGSSGGPLVDALGHVIGINTAIGAIPGAPVSETVNIGISFAIPIDYARTIAQELIQTGRATHPYLGVSADTITADDAASSGRVAGALLHDLDPAGPAMAAGLRIGDVVTKVDGTSIATAAQLLEAAQTRQVGDRLTISYVRAGTVATAQVTLTEQNG